MILYLMQGIPGSGKTTVAKMIRANTAGVILSTDDFWYEVTEGGVTYRGDIYRFDPKRLGEAHSWNQENCDLMMEAQTPSIIIDNTNITQSAIDPYLDLANKYEYSVQLVSVQVPVEVAISRQMDRPEDRRVPEETIRRMHKQMNSDSLLLS